MVERHFQKHFDYSIEAIDLKIQTFLQQTLLNSSTMAATLLFKYNLKKVEAIPDKEKKKHKSFMQEFLYHLIDQSLLPKKTLFLKMIHYFDSYTGIVEQFLSYFLFSYLVSVRQEEDLQGLLKNIQYIFQNEHSIYQYQMLETYDLLIDCKSQQSPTFAQNVTYLETHIDLRILAETNIFFNQNKKGVYYLEKLINYGNLCDIDEVLELTNLLKEQHQYLNSDLFQDFIILEDIVRDESFYEPKVKERMEKIGRHVGVQVPRICLFFEYLNYVLFSPIILSLFTDSHTLPGKWSRKCSGSDKIKSP